MRRIEALIAELGPAGVESKALGELGEFIRGRRFTKADVVSEGIGSIHYGEIYTEYGTWTTRALSHIRADLAPSLRFARCGDVVIAAVGETVEDVCKAVAWLGDDDVAVHDDCFIYRHEMDPKFVSYCFQTRAFHAEKAKYVARAKVKRVSGESLGRLRIPVPPIEIQREIASILDGFAELEAELEAELRARERQYAHYREALLRHRENVDWMTLGDVGKVSMCKRVFKGETAAHGDVPFFKIGTFGGAPDAFISRDLYDDYRSKYPFPKRGDVLISAAGTIGRAVVYDGQDAYFQDSNIVWVDNPETVVLNRYLFFVYQVAKWETDGGTIRRLYNENLRRMRFPVPSLREQLRVVDVLDKFDALVNDSSIGLPAEIAARRRQYEHYRDRLLTFDPAPA